MRQYALAVLLLCFAGATARMSQGFKASVMDKHNEYRKEQNARYMSKLSWDDKLENHAESYVSDCSYDDMGGASGNYGYNAAFYRASGNDEENMHMAMNDWYNQRENYQYNPRSCGASCSYTQMVWSNTQKLGCAYRKCDSFSVNGESMNNYWFFACFYDPSGNMEGEYPYMKGNRCGDCDNCEDGLCVGGPKQCVDVFDDCARRSRSCNQSPWMRKFCMQTCGNC